MTHPGQPGLTNVVYRHSISAACPVEVRARVSLGRRPPQRSRSRLRGSLCPDQFPDAIFDFVRLGEAVERMFREDLSSIQEDFECSDRTGSDGDPSQVVGVIVQQVLRQTGGSREIPSRRAIFDAHKGFLRRGVRRHHFTSCAGQRGCQSDLVTNGIFTRPSVAWNGKLRDSLFTSSSALARRRV